MLGNVDVDRPTLKHVFAEIKINKQANLQQIVYTETYIKNVNENIFSTHQTIS